MTRRHNNNARGFTLIELLVTLSVAAIFATVAVPSYTNFIANQRVKTGTQALLSSLMLARAEAIKRNGTVTVSRTGSDWAGGWTISFTDGGGTTTQLRTQQTLDGVSVTTADASIAFTRTGRASASGSFVFCDSEGRSGVSRREIALDTSGRASISHSGDCSS